VLHKIWQPIQGAIQIIRHERRNVYEFDAVGPNYYALIATAITDPVQTVVPTPVDFVEPEQSNFTAVVAGLIGGVLFLVALISLWCIRRRNQRHMVLAAYYRATVATARQKNINIAPLSKILQFSDVSFPESSVAGPRQKLPTQIFAVKQPNQVAVPLNRSPPPPPSEMSANKSSVAAAIRSKIKHSNRLKFDLQAIALNQDLELELDNVAEHSQSFVSQISQNAEGFEMYSDVDALEVESVDSDENGERLMDGLSSCSALSMAEKPDISDLEDAGLAPPVALPLNDFEEDLNSLKRATQAQQKASDDLDQGTSRPLPSFAATSKDAAMWKEQNSNSFDA